MSRYIDDYRDAGRQAWEAAGLPAWETAGRPAWADGGSGAVDLALAKLGKTDGFDGWKQGQKEDARLAVHDYARADDLDVPKPRQKPPADAKQDQPAKKKDKDERATLIELRDTILDREFFAVSRGGWLYAYVRERGYYVGGPARVKVEGREIENFGEAYLWDRLIKLLQENGEEKRWSTRLFREVLELVLKAVPMLRDERHPYVLNVENGLLEVRPGRAPVLRPHTPAHRYPYRFTVRYQPGAECPRIREFWSQVGPDDAPDLMGMIATWLLMPSNPASQMLLLYAAGSNGKSTFSDVIRSLIDEPLLSFVGLDALAKNRFTPIELFMKLVNITGDLADTNLRHGGPLKQLTGEDPITADQKHKKPVTFLSHAKLIALLNRPLTVNDSSHGWQRRLVVVPFTKTFGDGEGQTAKRDRGEMVAEMTTPEEKSGLLNWALNLWRSVALDGISLSPSTEEAKASFILESNPLSSWIEDTIEADPYGSVRYETLWQDWLGYASKARVPVGSKKSFTQAVLSAFPAAQKGKRGSRGEQYRAIIGVNWGGLGGDDGSAHPSSGGGSTSCYVPPTNPDTEGATTGIPRQTGGDGAASASPGLESGPHRYPGLSAGSPPVAGLEVLPNAPFQPAGGDSETRIPGIPLSKSYNIGERVEEGAVEEVENKVEANPDTGAYQPAAPEGESGSEWTLGDLDTEGR